MDTPATAATAPDDTVILSDSEESNRARKKFPSWLIALASTIVVALVVWLVIPKKQPKPAEPVNPVIAIEAPVQPVEVPVEKAKPEVIPVTKIALNKTSLSLEEGKSETLKLTYTPSNATDKTTTWQSNNTSVATVDKSGKVTARKAGAASITATCGGLFATCTVGVTAPQPSVQQSQSQTTGSGTASSASATTGSSNVHEWVDLGLSVKWATCNVGASSPSDYGNYYAWGETTTKSDYSWSNLKYCTDSTGDHFSKYVRSSDTKYWSGSGSPDNKTRLEMSDDAARQNWGGRWRMPTDAEWTELVNKCTWTWTSQGGHDGYKVTSKTNGNSIFLPAAGCRNGSSSIYVGSRGYYWSSSLFSDYSWSAYGMFFNSGYHGVYNLLRYYGQSVRPVTE